MHIVLINGPAGSGKNTLAKQTRIELFKLLNESRMKPKTLAWRVGVEEFKQPLIDMLFAFAESLSIIELGTSRQNATVYEELKVTRMLGHTGREWQIAWSEAMRAKVPDLFVNFVTTKITNMALDVALIPDCGFVHELMEGRPTLERTVVYLDGWKKDSKRYANGERFDNDIRFCLREHAEIVNPHPADLAALIYSKMSQLRHDAMHLTA